MVTRQKIMSDARELLGSRWVHQGRNPPHAIDCGGVVVYIAKKNNLSLFDVTGYGRRPIRTEFEEMFLRGGAIRIPLSEASYGDIILTKIKTFPSHCGIMCRVMDRGGWRPTFIHAYAPYRKVIESPYDNFWKSLTWGALRFPGVED